MTSSSQARTSLTYEQTRVCGMSLSLVGCYISVIFVLIYFLVLV